ncbi:nuclear transport factor 2 family protein [Halogeometricum sp. S1BR25-6]|uniref:Nuclear transport factor 2 family protein n=1 Tax=Halogeometricum salsisoli TaxID=2950536 RepID=A0ABU2GIW4_9EURY|nr:nuclear transport factor 2 family protein [Halogeometricum sp. S1BR25-6]MDS0300735.1 nuclear transport factor 2 family protein [Halogeometricum sp. S1BR25-6]
MATQQQDNADALREGYKAFNERDFEAVMELFDETIEWIEPEGSRYRGTYHGPEAVGSMFERLLSDIADFAVEPDRILQAGQTVVALGHHRGTAVKAGETLTVPFAHVWDMEDGRVTRVQHYTDTAQFEQALTE